jgi:CRP/FNR family cyclic AMP-dependent transcriptional regulator
MADENKELLKRSDIFRGLDDAQIEALYALGERQSLPEGTVIVEEDQQGKTCYFIVDGRVDIEIRPPFSGRSPQKLATIKRGEVFGELSLVDGFLRSATCRAMEPVEVIAFSNEALERLMEQDPKIGFRIMRNVANVLSSRIRSTNMKLRNALADVFYY